MEDKHESISLLDLACDFHQRGDLLGLFDQDVRMKIPVKELRPTMSEVVDILAILCSNSNFTARIHSTTNIADISSYNLSSTRMHYGNAVSSSAVLDYNDGVATGSSSNSVPEVDEINKDIEFHHDFISNEKVSVGEVGKSDMPLSQVTATSAEPLGLNIKQQTSSFSMDTYNQKGVQNKLKLFEPFFEEGKLHIEFSDEEFRAICDEWENSLVKGDFSAFTIENGYFICWFSCVEEKMRILESADLIYMGSLPIWVKIYNLPLIFWTPVLSKVGSGLGTPLYADQKTLNKQQLAYAMFCIEFDANKTLPESLCILVKGMEYHLKLEYDWKPLRCGICCTFGHIDLNCRAKMKARKQN
ncbi:hypothetical protein MKW98_003670 [Papaver atlanticum]|uniref:DUF4283 domain-containing protein n=1 Tax=Papaver atlanticum TaxID=357466 RepID=A0AAD4SH99_9MAGN|nr:hypothetical protein MKW98_003670 [Papaver atlanticum]